MGALKINVSDTSGQSWPLVLHQTLNQNSTGWGPGIKFLNASDSSSKWAGIGGMASSGYANNNDLVFYTQAEARFRMNNNTFYPIGDAVYNLGGPTVRWANVYGVNFHGKADTVNTVEISSINDFNNFVEICRGKFHIAMLYGNKQLPEFTNAGTSVSGWMTGLICCQSDGAFSAFYHSHQSDKLYFASGSNGTNFTRHHQIAYLDQVLPLSGGTMSGALNFANATWNKLGDDVQFGDRNKPGGFFIQGLNGTTNLTFTQYGGAAEGSISFDGSNFSISNYIVGTISNADTLDGYHADSFASASGSNNYVRVYNSNNVGGSSTVTFNDLAKQGFAAAMIHAAEDSPRGKAGWVHGLSMAWGAGSNTDWISQLAFGVQDSNGLWYRTNQSACVGKPWKRVLDSSNYTDYAAPAAYSWRTGNASDANGSSHYLNGAWRTSDGCANVPQGNGFLWSINGDGGGNTTVQFSGTYNMSNIYYRSKWYNNGWTNWYTLLSSNNYNSYSPTLTGGGAHGTWGINITGSAGSAGYLNPAIYQYTALTGQWCYVCFARITVTGSYSSRPGVIVLSSRNRNLCTLQIRFPSENTTDPSTIYLHYESGSSYHGIFAIKVAAGTWDLYYSKSEAWDDVTVHQYYSTDFTISFPGGSLSEVPSNAIGSSPLPNRGTVNYGNSKPTHEDFAGMVYYQLI